MDAGPVVTTGQPIPAKTLARLREVEAMYAANPDLCDWCEGHIPSTSRRDTRTCSEACRKALSRHRTSKETP